MQRRILYVAIMKAWAITHAPSTAIYSEIELQDHKTRGTIIIGNVNMSKLILRKHELRVCHSKLSIGHA